ncbi:MAG TPA: hypothetical protein VNT81_06135 [Vicinamibacterales bacterium]|jgi:hypothetical protein|nr:hypothetical protein [Vicinamibacterales bacterium]
MATKSKGRKLPAEWRGTFVGIDVVARPVSLALEVKSGRARGAINIAGEGGEVIDATVEGSVRGGRVQLRFTVPEGREYAGAKVTIDGRLVSIGPEDYAVVATTSGVKPPPKGKSGKSAKAAESPALAGAMTLSSRTGDPGEEGEPGWVEEGGS